MSYRKVNFKLQYVKVHLEIAEENLSEGIDFIHRLAFWLGAKVICWKNNSISLSKN